MKKKKRKMLAAVLTAVMTGSMWSGASFAQVERESILVYEKEEAQTALEEASVLQVEDAVTISFSDEEILVDGEPITWATDAAVARTDSIVYYEDRDTYDSGNAYGEGSALDKHTDEEAAENQAVLIREAGTYRLSGSLSAGQIQIDLGEDASEDEKAVVTLLLDNVDITCTIAPAIVFYNVYECDSDWSSETASATVNTEGAGANLIIGDGSENTVTGSHVAKIYKDNGNAKKLWKQDGAVYSYMSMNIYGETEGTGTLNIVADNEGLDTELHLTINGGNINIFAQDDGINTNEDGVSVTTINGGKLHIIAGLGEEGDGVDSNGWLVINGGTVVATANPGADSGLDSDMGSYINGGTVLALGSTMDWAESDSNQVTMNLQFANNRNQDESIVITDEEGNVVFAYAPAEDEVIGSNLRTYQGAVISCSTLEVENIYFVYMGAVIEGEEAQGVYDVSTVTGIEDGVLQMYTGTDLGQIFGPGSQKPDEDDVESGETPPEKPDGDDAESGETPPEKPDGDDAESGETPPEKPDGDDTESGETPPELPDGENPSQPSEGDTESSIYFYLSDKVNAFSGVQNNDIQSDAIYGDADGDKKITAEDALVILKYVIGMETEINKAAADCDGSEGVTAEDALAILKHVAGGETEGSLLN